MNLEELKKDYLFKRKKIKWILDFVIALTVSLGIIIATLSFLNLFTSKHAPILLAFIPTILAGAAIIAKSQLRLDTLDKNYNESLAEYEENEKEKQEEIVTTYEKNNVSDKSSTAKKDFDFIDVEFTEVSNEETKGRQLTKK